jgi:hypothetical protein
MYSHCYGLFTSFAVGVGHFDVHPLVAGLAPRLKRAHTRQLIRQYLVGTVFSRNYKGNKWQFSGSYNGEYEDDSFLGYSM